MLQGLARHYNQSQRLTFIIHNALLIYKHRFLSMWSTFDVSYLRSLTMSNTTLELNRRLRNCPQRTVHIHFLICRLPPLQFAHIVQFVENSAVAARPGYVGTGARHPGGYDELKPDSMRSYKPLWQDTRQEVAEHTQEMDIKQV